MDRTTSRTDTDGETIDYSYLGLSGEVLNEEVAGEVQKSYQYSPWGKRLSQVKTNTDGTTEDGYYGYNPHTDVETVTGESGNPISTYSYTAYGKDDEAEFTGVDAPDAGTPGEEPYNVYRYSAKRWDAASGTYDMGFRDYAPAINRFLSRDMYSGALADLNLSTSPWNNNRYALTGGNPTTLVELDGHRSCAIDCMSGDAYQDPTGRIHDPATPDYSNLPSIGRPVDSSPDSLDLWTDRVGDFNDDYSTVTGAYTHYWRGEQRYYDRHAARYVGVMASGFQNRGQSYSPGRSRVQLERMASQAGRAESLARTLRGVGPLTSLAGGLFATAEQASNDAADPTLSTADRTGRAIVRGTLVAGGSAVVGGGAAAVCGALSGGLLAVGCGYVGAQAGALAGNWVADKAIPYVDDAIDLGGKAWDKGTNAIGNAVSFVNPFD